MGHPITIFVYRKNDALKIEAETERRRSSFGPSTSHKKRKIEEVWKIGRLEAVENEDVIEEEEPLLLRDEIKTEQPEFQEQVVGMENSESIERKRMEMEISFKRDENTLLTSETTMLKKEKMELQTEITLMRMENAKLTDDVQKLQEKLFKQQKKESKLAKMHKKTLDLRLNESKLVQKLHEKLFKQQEEILDIRLNESKLEDELKIKDEKVEALALQLKTQMHWYKTKLETLSSQHQSTSTENNALSKENEKLKDAIDKMLQIASAFRGSATFEFV